MKTGVRGWIGLAVALVALGGCGRRGDPLPPIVEVPETTTDLVAVQVGTDAMLLWSYPQLTRAGNTLQDLARVEVWKLAVPPGQESMAEGPGGEEMRRQLMVSRGKMLTRLEGPSLESATRGSSLTLNDPLPTAEPGTSSAMLWYAVRSRRRDGTVSALSNIASLQPKASPPQLQGLEATVGAGGIRLSWQAVPNAAYMVERRDPAGGGAWEIIARQATATELDDAGVRQNMTWRYRARAVVDGVFGPPSAEKDVGYLDVYAPPPATGLICLPGAGTVRLRWDPSPEDGVKYRVFRRQGDARYANIEPGTTATELADTAAPAGDVDYAVKVVDVVGNESEPVYCSARGSG